MRFLLVLLVLLTLITAGCVTTNMKHNVKHARAARQNLRELHQNFDRYLLE